MERHGGGGELPDLLRGLERPWRDAADRHERAHRNALRSDDVQSAHEGREEEAVHSGRVRIVVVVRRFHVDLRIEVLARRESQLLVESKGLLSEDGPPPHGADVARRAPVRAGVDADPRGRRGGSGGKRRSVPGREAVRDAFQPEPDVVRRPGGDLRLDVPAAGGGRLRAPAFDEQAKLRHLRRVPLGAVVVDRLR